MFNPSYTLVTYATVYNIVHSFSISFSHWYDSVIVSSNFFFLTKGSVSFEFFITTIVDHKAVNSFVTSNKTSLTTILTLFLTLTLTLTLTQTLNLTLTVTKAETS